MQQHEIHKTHSGAVYTFMRANFNGCEAPEKVYDVHQTLNCVQKVCYNTGGFQLAKPTGFIKF